MSHITVLKSKVKMGEADLPLIEKALQAMKQSRPAGDFTYNIQTNNGRIHITTRNATLNLVRYNGVYQGQADYSVKASQAMMNELTMEYQKATMDLFWQTHRYMANHQKTENSIIQNVRRF